jgi:hypothetical protein
VLDLEREQCFVQLSGHCLLGRKEEVPGDLHGDGRRALPLAAADYVGVRCAQNAKAIHTGMLIEALVLGSKDRLLHGVWHLADGNQVSSLLDELANQVAVGGEYAQGDLGPVVRQRLEGGQPRVSKNDQDSQQGNGDQQSADEQRQGQQYPPQRMGCKGNQGDWRQVVSGTWFDYI